MKLVTFQQAGQAWGAAGRALPGSGPRSPLTSELGHAGKR